MIIAYLALISGLLLSVISEYFSIVGLMSIFSAAPVATAVMGIALGIGKLVATVWLKTNWTKSPKLLKGYLVFAVCILMFLTVIGSFGYLSKAHLDQAMPTGDVVDKVALIDEKIATQRENINVARKALQQLDASVDQVMARSTTEQGASKSAQLRKAQAKERASLQADIAAAQSQIAKLNDERAPVAKELRKVEAEVGPIKYIAALIYGDDLNQNLLESAVRWVIILIVIIFDPLAIVLLLASQYSFQWERLLKIKEPVEVVVPEKIEEINLSDINFELAEAAKETTMEKEMELPQQPEEFDISTQSYLKKPWVWRVPGSTPVGPQVYRPEQVVEPVVEPEVPEEVINTPVSDGYITKDQDKQIKMVYVQNSEQTKNSLWSNLDKLK